MDNTNFFDYTIVSRGRTIFREESYKIIKESKQSIDAIVYGTHDYMVHLEFNESGKLLISKSSCSCPCSFPCKHMAALVLHHDQKYKNDFNAVEMETIRKNDGPALLDTIERNLREITAYYSSPYSTTKLISESLDKIEKLNKEGKLLNCKDKCKAILGKLLSVSFQTDSLFYYSNTYVEPLPLIKRTIKTIDTIGIDSKEETVMEAMLGRSKIKSKTLNELLICNDTSTLISNAIRLVIKENKADTFFSSFASACQGIDIEFFPENTVSYFFFNYFERITLESRCKYISQVFAKTNVDEINKLINTLVRKGSVGLLQKEEIFKLDNIDHKEALRVTLSYNDNDSLDWIGYFLTLVKEDDSNERFQFEIKLDNLVKKGIYAPLLLRSSSKVDLRKISIEDIYSISNFIKEEYKPRIIEYVFNKAEKDLDLKSEKINEILYCCMVLDKMDPSYCSKLLLNSKMEGKIKESDFAMGIYFQLLDKYNLLEEKGFRPYRG